MEPLGDHLPNHLVDRLLAEAVTEDEASLARRHLEACAACASKLQTARAEREAFLLRHPPAAAAARLRTLAREGPNEPRRRWWRWPALALPPLAATALVVLMLGPRFGADPQRPDVLAKGGGAGVFVIHRGDRSWVAAGTEALQAGDAVDPKVPSGPQAQWLLLVLSAPETVQPLGAGGPEAPSAPPRLTLDAANPSQRLLLFTSMQPLNPQSLEARLREALRAAGGEPSKVDALALAKGVQAQVTSLLIEAERR
ncbi:MAG: hypothetical protein QM765_46890 [Myxococcales bacterium]